MRAMILSLALLSACQNEASAEQQYQIAMNSGNNADACAAARRVTDDALAQGQQARFNLWRPMRDIACDAAAREPGGSPRP